MDPYIFILNSNFEWYIGHNFRKTNRTEKSKRPLKSSHRDASNELCFEINGNQEKQFFSKCEHRGLLEKSTLSPSGYRRPEILRKPREIKLPNALKRLKIVFLFTATRKQKDLRTNG